MNIKNLIDELAEKHILTKEELVYIIKNINDEDRKYLSEKASCLRDKYYGKKVYLRALLNLLIYAKMIAIIAESENQIKMQIDIDFH